MLQNSHTLDPPTQQSRDETPSVERNTMSLGRNWWIRYFVALVLFGTLFIAALVLNYVYQPGWPKP
jgi:hypothetical protein